MVRALSRIFEEKPTLGQRAADRITILVGSWGFIIGFFIFVAAWMSLNIYMIKEEWDPYPFILLNLALSCLAAIQAPIILMSQNRSAQKDRLKAEFDLAVNIKAEEEIKSIQADLEQIKAVLKGIGSRLKNRRKKL